MLRKKENGKKIQRIRKETFKIGFEFLPQVFAESRDYHFIIFFLNLLFT